MDDSLKFLPQDRKYKVIFMNRNIQEIVMSQQKFIGKENAPYPMILENRYKKHIAKMNQWFAKTNNMDVLYINYSDAINQPEKTSKQIKDFLNLELKIESMTTVADKKLYRNKKNEN